MNNPERFCWSLQRGASHQMIQQNGDKLEATNEAERREDNLVPIPVLNGLYQDNTRQRG